MGSDQDVDVQTEKVCVLRKDSAIPNWRPEGAAGGNGDVNDYDNENDNTDRNDNYNDKTNTKMRTLTTKIKIPRTMIGW